VELLIVMAVLGMMAVICVPSGIRAVAMTRRAQCAANLHTIGQVFPIYYTENPGERESLSDDAWATALKPYFNDRITQYICPEDIEPDWAWPMVGMRTDWIGGRDEFVFEIDPIWLEGDHNDFVTEIGKPKLWKVNDDVYQAMGSNRQDMPQYTPGTNPNEYWFILEDIGDEDFYDFDLHVKEVAPGIVEVTGKHWPNALAGHHIIDPDGELHEVIDTVGPLEFATPETSYGINSLVHRITPGMRKILLLDYESKVCHVLDHAVTQPGWDQLKAPRHLDKANVLFADGSVEALSIEPINPEIISPTTKTLWDGAAR